MFSFDGGQQTMGLEILNAKCGRCDKVFRVAMRARPKAKGMPFLILCVKKEGFEEYIAVHAQAGS